MADPAAFTSRDHPEARAKRLNVLKGRVDKLTGATTAIPNDASGAANQATVNAILAALRTAGIIPE